MMMERTQERMEDMTNCWVYGNQLLTLTLQSVQV